MKKVVLPVIVLLIAGVAVYFLFWNQEEKPQTAAETLQPLSIEERSNVFNNSYNQLLAAYVAVKDGLVKSDTAAAAAAARQLATAADSLKVSEIRADEMIQKTAKDFAATITTSAQAIASEGDLNAKRKEFEIIADAMWSLTRTVKYDGQKLYWHYCPMAFNNRGAYWMSTSAEVLNPYFGDAMLHCGSVEDSLDYSNK
jgi:lipopolysaccharide export system protein LptC